jgi:hypothetical protein
MYRADALVHSTAVIMSSAFAVDEVAEPVKEGAIFTQQCFNVVVPCTIYPEWLCSPLCLCSKEQLLAMPERHYFIACAVDHKHWALNLAVTIMRECVYACSRRCQRSDGVRNTV